MINVLPTPNFGVVPTTAAERADELLGSVALGVTSGAVTAMLLIPKRRKTAFKVLMGALIVDALLISAFSRKYGGH